MTDKATIQPKSKPEKTTISISGETSERLEIYMHKYICLDLAFSKTVKGGKCLYLCLFIYPKN